MGAFGLNMILGSLYPLVLVIQLVDSYFPDYFIVVVIVETIVIVTKIYKDILWELQQSNTFRGGNPVDPILIETVISDFRQDQSFHMKENNDCICITKSI